MLLGEDLGRGHEGALEAVFCGHVNGGGGDHRLARANVALTEAVHRALKREVARDVVDGAALRGGEGKGKGCKKGRRIGVAAALSRDERAARAQ